MFLVDKKNSRFPREVFGRDSQRSRVNVVNLQTSSLKTIVEEALYDCVIMRMKTRYVYAYITSYSHDIYDVVKRIYNTYLK